MEDDAADTTAPKGFIMTLDPGMPSARLLEWGCKRFCRFRTLSFPDKILVGGLFNDRRRRGGGDGGTPKSLKAFQRLVGTNLKNWGDEHESYKRGWLRFCDKDEYLQTMLGPELDKKWKKMARAKHAHCVVMGLRQLVRYKFNRATERRERSLELC